MSITVPFMFIKPFTKLPVIYEIKQVFMIILPIYVNFLPSSCQLKRFFYVYVFFAIILKHQLSINIVIINVRKNEVE